MLLVLFVKALDFHLCVCSELEQYVVTLQKDSATTNRAVTLKDVEEGAVTLRKVGESLAGLKGETVKSYPILGTIILHLLHILTITI